MLNDPYVVCLEVARREFAALEAKQQEIRDRLVKVRAVVFTLADLLGVPHELTGYDLRSSSTRARRRKRK